MSLALKIAMMANNIDRTVDYLIAAGGGSGGDAADPSGKGSGTGGAGGLLEGSILPLAAGAYPITIGVGGEAPGSGTSSSGQPGTDSTAFGLAAIGGGRGGANTTSGGPGGSGGGGSGGNAPGGAGTDGQGFDGQAGGPSAGGKGGGAGGLGADGGPGVSSSISGASVVYCAGGSNANRGNPGGGGAVGQAGRNGIVIIRYRTGAYRATGGTVSTDGGYTIHTFTSNGTFTVNG